MEVHSSEEPHLNTLWISTPAALLLCLCLFYALMVCFLTVSGVFLAAPLHHRPGSTQKKSAAADDQFPVQQLGGL